MAILRSKLQVCLCLLALWLAPQAFATEVAPGLPTRNYPLDWNARFVDEPVLGSRLQLVSAGDPGKPALLLVHGLGQNGLMDWQPIIEALKADYYILAPDLPGFGRSSLPAGHLSPANYAALLEWLRREEGLRDLHLVGHSMGGAVALYYAARYPDSLQQLTLVDAAGILHRAAFVKSMASVNRERYSFLPKPLQRKAAQLLDFGDSLVEQVNLLPDVTVWLRNNDVAWRALLSDQPNSNAALALINTDYSHIIDALRVPTTIIWGEQDPIAPLRSAQLLNYLIPGSELHVIAGAQHVPLQTHSAQVAGLIRRGWQDTAKLSPAQPAAGDLYCRGLTGAKYSGHYRRIFLDSCLNTELSEVRAEYIEVLNSNLAASGLHIAGQALGLRAYNSSLQLTGASISAKVAVELDASRADLAGVHLQGETAGLRVKRRSVIIASVSEADSPRYRGKLHGMVKAYDAVGEALKELQSGSSPLQ